MKIEQIDLHHITMPLVHPFRTSYGIERTRSCILVSVHSEGVTGWGECVAGLGPWYTGETIQTAWHILSDYLLPATLGQMIEVPDDILPHLDPLRGHPMAKAALETAVWDLVAKTQNVPLSQLWNGARERVEVGVSIGIQPTIDALLSRVEGFVAAGYQRVKVKIKPEWALEPLAEIRAAFPHIRLMADANSAFTLADAPLLRQLDELDLLMIEQPLGYDDIADHARLQAQLSTPICLDESIHSLADVQAAIDLGACRVINLKVGRVGGIRSVLRIHALCVSAEIKLWCGGMLETGIGRATNIHLATLPNFTLPGDISATDRYYAQDIADPPFVLNTQDSSMTVPTGAGIGVTILPDQIAAHQVRRHSVRVSGSRYHL